MTDLRYRMLMALNAADFGSPLCEQVVSICAEVAEQYCAETHLAGELADVAVPEMVRPMPVPAVTAVSRDV